MLTAFDFCANDPLYSIRSKASLRLNEIGYPTRKTEVYRYIKLNKIYEMNWEFQKSSTIETVKNDEVNLIPLDLALKTFGGYLQHRFSKSLKEESDPFAMANCAYHQDAQFVYVPPKCHVKAPVQFFYKIDGPLILMPRIHIFVGASSKLDIIITQNENDSESFLNSLLDIHLEENATLNLILSSENTSGYSFEAVRATLKRDAFLNCVSTTKGSKCFRQDFHISLNQEGSCTHLNGLSCLDGPLESHTNILVEHLAPNCCSKQLFKGVLEGISRSSFEGKIFVKKEAQQTDAFQLNNYLLLNEHAQAYSKPNLEIFADDVKASHGATVGQISDDELFYLQTRGIPKKMAKKLLIQSFCEEVLSCIPGNLRRH